MSVLAEWWVEFLDKITIKAGAVSTATVWGVGTLKDIDWLVVMSVIISVLTGISLLTRTFVDFSRHRREVRREARAMAEGKGRRSGDLG